MQRLYTRQTHFRRGHAVRGEGNCYNWFRRERACMCVGGRRTVCVQWLGTCIYRSVKKNDGKKKTNLIFPSNDKWCLFGGSPLRFRFPLTTLLYTSPSLLQRAVYSRYNYNIQTCCAVHKCTYIHTNAKWFFFKRPTHSHFLRNTCLREFRISIFQTIRDHSLKESYIYIV